jgi:ubiquitin carboxyl-terminal hydrolase 25/28
MGILMHEGKAQSGHYYSYLHNFEKNLWQKFNDIHVTEEQNEVKIFEEAYGIKQSHYFKNDNF